MGKPEGDRVGRQADVNGGASKLLKQLEQAAFGLTACQIKMSPLKTDFAFSPESAEALVAIHAHKHIRRTDVVLRRVDLENRQFVRGQVRVTLQNSFVARALSAPLSAGA